jgi:hypothetical protein
MIADNEFPGMWSNSDFTGGETDCKPAGNLTIKSCVEIGKKNYTLAEVQALVAQETAKLREEIAGLQAMLKQKDEAIKYALEATESHGVYLTDLKAALALTSPTAALEAVRAEDKAEIDKLTQQLKNSISHDHSLARECNGRPLPFNEWKGLLTCKQNP